MNCPICGSGETCAVYEKKNLFFMNRDLPFAFTVEICDDCRFLYQTSAYSEEYDNLAEAVYSGFDKSRDFVFPNETVENKATLDFILSHLPQETDFKETNKKDYKGINILEIGSNRGDLLYMLKRERPDINILGIEPTGFNHLEVPTIKSVFKKELFSCKFDVIVMQHVLEHFKYPAHAIHDIESLLTETGRLVIEVPNIVKSLENGTDDFMPEHVNYFNFHSLDRLLKNFTLIACDGRGFLRTVWEKGTSETVTDIKSVESFELRKGIAQLQKQEKELTNRLMDYHLKGRSLVFYGVSFYFMGLFKGLREKLNLDNCFFCDDNYQGNIEKTFGLPRINELDDNCIVVICSNNRNVQDRMAGKLKGCRGMIVIKPWNTIETIS